MSIELEHKLEKIPVIKYIVRFGKSIKLPYSEGLTLYHLAELYISGIVKGDITYRAGAIAFSFFMTPCAAAVKIPATATNKMVNTARFINNAF